MNFHPTAEKILNKARSGEKRTFIFDLDSTLFCVSPRSQFILREFAQLPEIQAEFPTAAKQVQSIELTPSDWGIKTGLIRHKVVAPLLFFEKARLYWIEHFFSNEALEHDILYDGAKKFVDEVQKAQVEIFYLTGRDNPRMGEGTERILKKWGLPIQSSDHLIMKPNRKLVDSDYKAQVLKSRWKDHSNLVFFENEPVIINQVHRELPKIEVIFMGSVHSGVESPPPGISTLPGTYLSQK